MLGVEAITIFASSSSGSPHYENLDQDPALDPPKLADSMAPGYGSGSPSLVITLIYGVKSRSKPNYATKNLLQPVVKLNVLSLVLI